MNVCNAVKEFSQLTWLILEGRFSTNLSVGEETITDVSLIELQKSLGSATKIEKFTKKKEDLIGADWEWWIIEHGKVISLRVQAKILSQDMKYKSLNYVGKSKKIQIDTLINQAARDKCIPIYVFYNYVNTIPTFKCKDCGRRIYDEYEGVTYSFAPTIKSLVSGKARKSFGYHEVRPLSDFLVCLFCCKDNSKTLINTIVEMYEESNDSVFVEGIIKEKVPKYVKKILPDIELEEEDNDIIALPEYVIVTRI
ncbi:DUF6615 family protein [Rossellomorea marisflavi]|uniref:DUF6615 family protein n=1 Tax=Rossellomorea marisflavi TaxID=189381 RepID=UPI0039BF43F4